MKLYYFPVSTYSWKTLMAFHEKQVSFTPEIVNYRDPAARAKYEAEVHPLGKVPMLVLDNGWRIPESSIIIEYLDGHFQTGTRLIPEDRDLARRARFTDRMADFYINDPSVVILRDGRKPENEREPYRVAAAHKTLDKMYGILERDLAGKTWALGDVFSMGDLAAAAGLTLARRMHPFDAHGNIVSYFRRLTERPSYRKVMEEAEPYLR